MEIKNIKKEFPIFTQNIKGKPLVYLDSANSSQKPKIVIDRISNFYENRVFECWKKCSFSCC
jgi:cysteine desulfurase/selenocysteine lyase